MIHRIKISYITDNKCIKTKESNKTTDVGGFVQLVNIPDKVRVMQPLWQRNPHKIDFLSGSFLWHPLDSNKRDPIIRK